MASTVTTPSAILSTRALAVAKRQGAVVRHLHEGAGLVLPPGLAIRDRERAVNVAGDGAEADPVVPAAHLEVDGDLCAGGRRSKETPPVSAPLRHERDEPRLHVVGLDQDLHGVETLGSYEVRRPSRM